MVADARMVRPDGGGACFFLGGGFCFVYNNEKKKKNRKSNLESRQSFQGVHGVRAFPGGGFMASEPTDSYRI